MCSDITNVRIKVIFFQNLHRLSTKKNILVLIQYFGHIFSLAKTIDNFSQDYTNMIFIFFSFFLEMIFFRFFFVFFSVSLWFVCFFRISAIDILRTLRPSNRRAQRIRELEGERFNPYARENARTQRHSSSSSVDENITNFVRNLPIIFDETPYTTPPRGRFPLNAFSFLSFFLFRFLFKIV